VRPVEEANVGVPGKRHPAREHRAVVQPGVRSLHVQQPLQIAPVPHSPGGSSVCWGRQPETGQHFVTEEMTLL